MIKAAMEKVESMAKVEEIQVEDRIFLSRDNVTEVTPNRIKTLTVHSLQALVDYLNGEEIAVGDAMLHIEDPYTVSLMDAVADETYRRREIYMVAKRIHDEFSFGTYLDQEEMVIHLMTKFEQTKTLNDVIRVVSGLIVSQDVEVSDDGLSQEVKVRKGASRVEKVDIQNPILLQPYRSFLEIDQVEAPYVLRVKDIGGVPKVAIFEAGDMWKNEAIKRIKKWLAESIDGIKVVG